MPASCVWGGVSVASILQVPLSPSQAADYSSAASPPILYAVVGNCLLITQFLAGRCTLFLTGIIVVGGHALVQAPASVQRAMTLLSSDPLSSGRDRPSLRQALMP